MRRFAHLWMPSLFVALVASACGSPSAPPLTAAAPETPQLSFEKYTLPNGLDVLLSQDHRLPTVSVDLWYHVGPANEAAGRTGFAHLFEHMMFEGSKHVPSRAHFRFVEAAGGTNVNGTTDFDRTNYFESLPSNQLELGLWLESDRMGYLLDTLDEAKLANQQDVVRNERREGEGQPYGIVAEEVFHTLFPKTHPYYAYVIGSHADIQAAKLADVRQFFTTYYAPNNASLAIVGDFDPGKTKALVEKYFGPLKRGPDAPKVAVQTPPLTEERKVVVKDRVQLPRVYLAWITPAYFTPGDAEADVTAGILGGGHSSRLYKSLVYDQQIALDVSAAQQSLRLGSVFQIIATASPGHTAEELQKAIDAEIARLGQQAPDAKEVARAETTFETQLLSGLEVEGGFGGVADTLNLFNQYTGDPGYLPKDLDHHRAVTADAVRQFVQTQLKPNARVIVYGVPGTPVLGPDVAAPKIAAKPGAGAQAVNADAAWRGTAPKPADAAAFHLPAPTTFTLANGLTVMLSTREGMPLVAASLLIKTGGDANPFSRPGLAAFSADLLDRGTDSRSAPQIADDGAQLGTAVQAGSSKDSTAVSVQALRHNFPAALDLLADVALHPSFPAKEIERERANRLGELTQVESDPSNIAIMAAESALYGAMHAYAWMEIGTEASIKALSRDELAGFWRQNFVPNNAALVVSGAISEAELRPIVERAFGAWKAGAPGGPAPSTMVMPTSARLVLVDRPGAGQTAVLVTQVGVARHIADYPSVSVMNLVLGGMFSSRINLNLREDHGYVYGAFSQFNFRKAAGPFWVSAQVRTDATAPAVSEIFKELTRMRTTPITPDELSLGRDAYLQSLPASFETDGSTVGSIGDLFVYDLGTDYYAKLPDQLNAVTAASVLQAAKDHLDPDRMIVVAVGDRAKIEPGLAALKLGPVEIRNVDGSVKR